MWDSHGPFRLEPRLTEPNLDHPSPRESTDIRKQMMVI